MLKDQAAALYLTDLACEVLCRYPGPMPWDELLHNVSLYAPVSGPVLEEVLGADERFEAEGSRWSLTVCAEAADRSLVGALQALLECRGKPLARPLIISQLCLSRPGDPLQMDALLARLLTSTRELDEFDHCLYLPVWLPRFGAAKDAGLLFLNDLTADRHFLSLRPKLLAAGHKQRQVLDTAESVLQAAKMLHNRPLGLILRAHHADRFDPKETLAQMACDDRFLCLNGPRWALASQEPLWHRALARAGETEATPERPVDLAQVLQTPPAQRIRLRVEAQHALRMLAERARTTVDAGQATRGVLGVRPRQRNFASAVHAVDAALRANPALVWQRPGRFLPELGVPAWMRTVPPSLLPEQTPLIAEHAAAALVPLEELPEDLLARVTDPSYEDVGDAAIAETEGPIEQTRLIIPWHHHRCGTMKLRRHDQRLFDLHTELTGLTFILPDGQRQPVWANDETGLLYGLLAWYDEALPPTGALLTIRRQADQGDEFAVEYAGETDAAAEMSEERLDQLLHLRERVHRRPATLAEVVTAVLQPFRKGLAFDPLWFQVNIARRTTRHQLASVLVLAAEQFAPSAGKWRMV